MLEDQMQGSIYRNCLNGVKGTTVTMEVLHRPGNDVKAKAMELMMLG